MNRQFEKDVREMLGIEPVETRLLLKIADGLTADLKTACRKTALANDMDALLVLTRLSFDEQRQLAPHIGTLITGHEAVELTIKGQIPAMLARIGT